MSWWTDEVMGYKLIATDMDGTLLNDEGKLPYNTYRAAAYLEQKGIKLVLCTGRPLLGVVKIYDDLNLTSPVVANNGAMVYLSKDGPLIHNETMSIDDALHVLKLNELFNCTVCMWHDNILYVSELNKYAYDYASITGVSPLLLKQIDLTKCKNGPTKFVFTDTLEKITSIKEQAATLSPASVTAVTTRPYFLEFFSSNISKTTALSILSKALNIDRKQMIAVGDGFNDIDMLDYAGFAVVAENGHDEVKKHADMVACSNNEGVIAYIVDNIIKKDK
ncbi:MAG TPA: Cof-type HAD-IIB family hydrolase [Clostridia bacterium]|nr:MAG: putative phosphatase [Firmicutes bacterium ADurb.Bin146]HQM38863.1 Cof-type HAD-IIB family hydrolase [Clostridia bacterium]